MASYPGLLPHGYSDAGRSFAGWQGRLDVAGYDARTIHVASWLSRANEVTLTDVASCTSSASRTVTCSATTVDGTATARAV